MTDIQKAMLGDTRRRSYESIGCLRRIAGGLQSVITPTRILPLTWRPDFTGKGQAMMDMAWCVWDLAQRGTTYFLPLGKPSAKDMEMLHGKENP